jgi:hypothetical protein
MNLNINIKNIEDINYINKLNDNEKEDILNTAISIGIKSIEMSKSYMSGNSYYDPLKNIIEESNNENKTELLEINAMLKDLMNIKNNSSRKGKLGESLAMNALIKKYPDWKIENTAGSAHEADLFAYSDKYGKILYEIKTYTTNVGNKEIDKFKNDVITTNSNYGIFISQTSGIVGKKKMDYEKYQDKILIYVACAGLNGHGLEFGTEFLLSLIESGCLNKKTIIKNTELEDILKIINDNMLELEECINNFSRIKSQVLDIKTIINSQIDLLHKHLIEYETKGNIIYDKILNIIKYNYDNNLMLISDINKVNTFIDKNENFKDIFLKLREKTYIQWSLDKNILYLHNEEKLLCKILVEEELLTFIFNINNDEPLLLIPKYERIENNKIIINIILNYEKDILNIIFNKL